MDMTNAKTETVRVWSDELGLGSSHYAGEMVRSGELDATSVVTIAGWFDGHDAMYRLSQGFTVPKDDVMDSLNDIECSWLPPLNQLAVDLVRKFVINH